MERPQGRCGIPQGLVSQDAQCAWWAGGKPPSSYKLQTDAHGLFIIFCLLCFETRAKIRCDTAFLLQVLNVLFCVWRKALNSLKEPGSSRAGRTGRRRPCPRPELGESHKKQEEPATHAFQTLLYLAKLFSLQRAVITFTRVLAQRQNLFKLKPHLH